MSNALWLITFCTTSVVSPVASSGVRLQYDEEDARVYLQASRAAFCVKEAIESWDCGDACDAVPVRKGFVRFIPGGDTYKVQAYVAQLNDTVKDHCLVAFRGSVDPMNWFADAKAIPSEWPPGKNASWCDGCYVHEGFAEAYAEIKDDIYAAIDELGCNSFVVAGHSLGAGCAQLASIELRAVRGALVDRVYLYGSPRAGNQKFVDTFDSLAVRQGVEPSAWLIVHHHDPVPRLAPRFWPFDFRFMPTQVYYNHDESLYKVCDDKDGEDPTCADSIPLAECLNFDHVNYFNKSMMHRYFSAECTGQSVANSSVIV